MSRKIILFCLLFVMAVVSCSAEFTDLDRFNGTWTNAPLTPPVELDFFGDRNFSWGKGIEEYDYLVFDLNSKYWSFEISGLGPLPNLSIKEVDQDTYILRFDQELGGETVYKVHFVERYVFWIEEIVKNYWIGPSGPDNLYYKYTGPGGVFTVEE